MENKEIITAADSVLSIMDKRLNIKGVDNMAAITDCAKVLLAVSNQLKKEEAETN